MDALRGGFGAVGSVIRARSVSRRMSLSQAGLSGGKRWYEMGPEANMSTHGLENLRRYQREYSIGGSGVDEFSAHSAVSDTPMPADAMDKISQHARSPTMPNGAVSPNSAVDGHSAYPFPPKSKSHLKVCLTPLGSLCAVAERNSSKKKTWYINTTPNDLMSASQCMHQRLRGGIKRIRPCWSRQKKRRTRSAVLEQSRVPRARNRDMLAIPNANPEHTLTMTHTPRPAVWRRTRRPSDPGEVWHRCSTSRLAHRPNRPGSTCAAGAKEQADQSTPGNRPKGKIRRSARASLAAGQARICIVVHRIIGGIRMIHRRVVQSGMPSSGISGYRPVSISGTRGGGRSCCKRWCRSECCYLWRMYVCPYTIPDLGIPPRISMLA